LVVLILAACAAPAAGPAGDSGAAEPEKVTIEYWFDPPTGGEGATCLVTTAVDPFNEASETIFVNAVSNPDTWNATRTAIAGGAGPDLVMILWIRWAGMKLLHPGL